MLKKLELLNNNDFLILQIMDKSPHDQINVIYLIKILLNIIEKKEHIKILEKINKI